MASNAMSGVKSPVLKPTKRKRKSDDYVYVDLYLGSTSNNHKRYTIYILCFQQ